MGSGTSHGIPVIGCDCPVCRSSDIRDKRTRAALYIQGDAGERVVIDTGPEFRLQALSAGITRLDAVLLTHAHADHIHGLDDIRALSWEHPIPVYANRATIAEMRERFAYIFKETQRGGGKPRIIPTEVTAPLTIGSLTFTPIPVKHGVLDILGWRIAENGAGEGANAHSKAAPSGNAKPETETRTAVYLTDTSLIPPSSLNLIRRAEVFIIGAIRDRPHETHFTFAQALATAIEVGARRVYLTHISHEHSHREIEAYCRGFLTDQELNGISVGPSWDGLELNLR
ncbi:MBL fold metallo-hydrolase [Spirochaetia bacterium]|nr:MBL fold metallo-hydrolase [Spirochaetia bacterium]